MNPVIYVPYLSIPVYKIHLIQTLLRMEVRFEGHVHLLLNTKCLPHIVGVSASRTVEPRNYRQNLQVEKKSKPFLDMKH